MKAPLGNVPRGLAAKGTRKGLGSAYSFRSSDLKHIGFAKTCEQVRDLSYVLMVIQRSL